MAKQEKLKRINWRLMLGIAGLALITSSAAAGIPDAQLAPLRSLITEGYELATDAGVSPMHWLTYSSRLAGALIAFEYEVVLPLAEVADVAAIA